MKKNQTKKERIAITGMGMVSSIGYTALSSIAAMLAGMVNFKYHERVMVHGDRHGTSLQGATVARIPDAFISSGLCGTDRSIKMILPAIKEATYGLARQAIAKSYCRIDSFADQKHNDDFMRELKERLPGLPQGNQQEGAPPPWGLGRCQTFENIIGAVQDLQQSKCQVALIGCVDSLCEESVLKRLAADERLIDGTNPEGIVAGEAAGAILLETESHARARNALVFAYVETWGQALEPHPWTGAKASAAKGLTDAIRDALSKVDAGENNVQMVINDLNGERARALEWGLAQARIIPPSCRYALMHPADCLGDCGAAMGVALVILGAGVMLMRREPPRRVVLSTSDDAGARRVLVLAKGDDLDLREVVGWYQEQGNKV